MSEEGREHLEAENEALREQNAAQAAEIERLTRMVDELTRRLDKGSKNSSIPPSADSPRHQAEATRPEPSVGPRPRRSAGTKWSATEASNPEPRPEPLHAVRSRRDCRPRAELLRVLRRRPRRCPCGGYRAPPGLRHPGPDHHHHRAPLGPQTVPV